MKKVTWILILTISLVACTKKQANFIEDSTAADSIEQVAPVTNEIYQQNVKEVLDPFWQSQNSQNVKESLLALTVPKDYLDLHFNLVVAFQKIEEGAKQSSQELIEEAFDDINNLAEEHPWLK